MVLPLATPVYTPVDEFTVAMAVDALLHTPPPVASASVALAPTHAVVVPVIEAGPELPTVNVKLAVQEPMV